MNRDHFRNKTVSIKELHKQTLLLHNFEAWKVFVEINEKTYPRYVRDQYIIAKNKLSNIADTGIFEMAVQYCLDNKTFSMTELKDTYRHKLKEHKEEQTVIHNAFLGLLHKPKPKGPAVAKRSVSEYETIVGCSHGGGK